MVLYHTFPILFYYYYFDRPKIRKPIKRQKRRLRPVEVVARKGDQRKGETCDL